MKRFLIPIIILCLNSCSNSQNQKGEQNIVDAPQIVDSLINTETIKNDIEDIKFTETYGQAVLIGEDIELLDNNLKGIADISYLSGKIVDLKGISDSLFNQGKNFEGFCKAFWYVEIQGEEINGIVNGRQVFKILDLRQGESSIKEGKSIEIFRTEFFGMGVVYQGDLMGCPVNQPVVIKDVSNNYYGLVDLVLNEYSKKASWDNEYPFFELRDDDGASDMIESINSEGTKYRLKIHRSYQEGENDYEVLLYFDNEKYKAEYLNFGEIKYE